MDIYCKLNVQTAGKDKLARLIQYASRVLWNYLQNRQMSPPSVETLKLLEYNLGTFRKLLRMGKSVEVLYGTFKTIHLDDLTLRLTISLSRIASALFLVTDHILWIGRAGLASVNTNKWAEISNKYWLLSIVMNLCRDFYELQRVLTLGKTCFRGSTRVVKKQISDVACNLVIEHQDVLWDTLKNSCDIWIPLTALGFTKLKPGTIGILGTISSIAGIVPLLTPYAKLLPAGRRDRF